MLDVEEYHYPKTIQEALSLISDGKSTVIAGGTYINIQKNRHFKRLVDISQLNLTYVKEERGEVHIGSTTTISEMMRSSIIEGVGNGILTRACSLIADTPLRNVITLGGNIARLVPWAGLPVVLLVLDAQIEIASQTETKRITSAVEFFREGGVRNDEIIREIIIPQKKDYFCRYERFALTATDYSWLTIGFSAKNSSGIVSDSHIAVSRICKPQRITNVEKLLNGRSIDPLELEEIIKTLRESVTIVSDYRSAKEYRKHLVGVLFKRILVEMQEAAQ